ncbi:unnamed protein product [Closterium sp. Yama58-4]|nr:unnamed protein product [Closterium sp. Yama58-4]
MGGKTKGKGKKAAESPSPAQSPQTSRNAASSPSASRAESSSSAQMPACFDDLFGGKRLDVKISAIDDVAARDTSAAAQIWLHPAAMTADDVAVGDMVAGPGFGTYPWLWYGIKPPRGILLHGPPGTGKTSLARAVAAEAGVALFVINGPELVSEFFGESEEALNEVFSAAQEAAPSISLPELVSEFFGESEEALNEVFSAAQEAAPSIVSDVLDTSAPPEAGPELVSEFFGESEEALDEVFSAAQEAAPSIVFIDELDAIAPARTRDAEDLSHRMVAALLTILDGTYELDAIAPARTRDAEDLSHRMVAALLTILDGTASSAGDGGAGQGEGRGGKRGEGEGGVGGKEKRAVALGRGVVVIGATNRVNAIDPALRRPGRFDREVEIGIPTPSDRLAILGTHLSRMAHALSPEAIHVIASSATHGFVGADISALCSEAAVAALRRIVEEKERQGGTTRGEGRERDQNLCDEDFEVARRRIRPSALREVAVEVPTVRWSDIGGLEGINQRLKEAVEWPYTRAHEMRAIGATPPCNTGDECTTPLSPSYQVAVEVPAVRWTDIGGLEGIKQRLKEAEEWPYTRAHEMRAIGATPPCNTGDECNIPLSPSYQVAVEVPAVRWTDIGGLEGIKQRLKEAEEWPYTRAHEMRAIGATPPCNTGDECTIPLSPSYQVAVEVPAVRAIGATPPCNTGDECTIPLSPSYQVAVEVPAVRWTDIGGLEGIKQRLKEAEEWPYTRAHEMRAIGATPPCNTGDECTIPLSPSYQVAVEVPAVRAIGATPPCNTGDECTIPLSPSYQVAVEVPAVRWTDIGGLEGIKQRLKEAVEWPYTRAHEMRAIGATPPCNTGDECTIPLSPSYQVAVEVPAVRWTDIGGLEGIKQRLKEAVEWPYTRAHEMRAIGATPPCNTGDECTIPLSPSYQVAVEVPAVRWTDIGGLEGIKQRLKEAVEWPGGASSAVDGHWRAGRHQTKIERSSGVARAHEMRAIGATPPCNTGDECTIPLSPSYQVAVEVPAVRWTDIGGLEGIKQRLKEAVEWPYTRAHEMRAIGATPPRGLLLYGPPGCSKTLLAKAVATEARLNFLAVKGPELLSKWVGESERAVRTLFSRAKAAAPAIVFFDEIDGLAVARSKGRGGGASGGVGDRVMTQLLLEMDALTPSTQVTVIAATNRPDLLDRALLRPGRFDRLLFVPPPDLAAREKIFALCLRSTPLHADVDACQLSGQLAARSEGAGGELAVGGDELAVGGDELAVGGDELAVDGDELAVGASIRRDRASAHR